MSKRTITGVLIALVVLLVADVFPALAGRNARRPALVDGAGRVFDLQRTDNGWVGTWY